MRQTKAAGRVERGATKLRRRPLPKRAVPSLGDAIAPPDLSVDLEGRINRAHEAVMNYGLPRGPSPEEFRRAIASAGWKGLWTEWAPLLHRLGIAGGALVDADARAVRTLLVFAVLAEERLAWHRVLQNRLDRARGVLSRSQHNRDRRNAEALRILGIRATGKYSPALVWEYLNLHAADASTAPYEILRERYKARSPRAIYEELRRRRAVIRSQLRAVERHLPADWRAHPRYAGHERVRLALGRPPSLSRDERHWAMQAEHLKGLLDALTPLPRIR